MAAKRSGKKERTYRVRTDDILAAMIDAAVEERGETASVLIRDAIREYLASRGHGLSAGDRRAADEIADEIAGESPPAKKQGAS